MSFWKNEEGHWSQISDLTKKEIGEEAVKNPIKSSGNEMMQLAIERQEKFLKNLELSDVVPEHIRLRIQDIFTENRSLPTKHFEEYTDDEKKDLAFQEKTIAELSQELHELDEQRFHAICKNQDASKSNVESLVA